MKMTKVKHMDFVYEKDNSIVAIDFGQGIMLTIHYDSLTESTIIFGDKDELMPSMEDLKGAEIWNDDGMKLNDCEWCGEMYRTQDGMQMGTIVVCPQCQEDYHGRSTYPWDEDVDLPF